MKTFAILSLLALATLPAQVMGENYKVLPSPLHATATDDDIIKNTPTGTLRSGLYRQSTGFFAGTKVNADGLAGSYVVGQNNTFYIYNIFSQYQPGSWVKGEVRGDTIYFPTPQHIDSFNDQGETLDLYLRNMKYDESNHSYSVDSVNTEVKFVLSGDTLKQVSPQLIGMTFGDDTWTRYGDQDLVMFVNRDEIFSVPENLKSTRYSLSYKDEYGDSQKRLVKLGFDGDDVWLGDLSEKYPGHWVKGTQKNGRITFDNSQYFGFTDNHHVYFVTGIVVPITDPETGETGETYELSRNIRFDSDGNDYASSNVMFTNWGKRDVNFRECYAQPRLSPFVETEQTPQNPTIQAFQAYDTSLKYGSVSFTIPSTSVTDEVLNPDSIFYNVFVDEKLFTFKTTRYGLDSDMTDIPLSFTNGQTFAASADDPSVHIVYFKERVGSYYSHIGIRAGYRGAGKVHYSDVVYNDGEVVSAGIKAVQTGASTVKYYNLSGQRVVNPQRGIFIRESCQPDGSFTRQKVVLSLH